MINLFWFRRDLRLHDNAGLYSALNEGIPVLPVFIFDDMILNKLQDRSDARVNFIHSEILKLKILVEKYGGSLLVKSGNPETIFAELIQHYTVNAVYTNHDYEPYARVRDSRVKNILQQNGIVFKTFKDQVIFEKDEVVKDSGEPYTVFTPYAKKWRALYASSIPLNFPSEKLAEHFLKISPFEVPSLSSLKFAPSSVIIPPKETDRQLIKNYHLTRDFPGTEGTTRLGIHLRFGTISIRQLVQNGVILNDTFLNELIWRDFYMMILWHFPHAAERSFKPQYDRVEWRNNEREFNAWCLGKTGYPIVDAGMRELNQTGYMHNRLRMVTASFLAKHLLIDWRWGESYFAGKLLDFELASNNGGWQWAAGTGCDAAPYFRVFNPDLQTEKFDPDKRYIRKWVPEYNTGIYPARIVDHATARNTAISVYKRALEKNI